MLYSVFRTAADKELKSNSQFATIGSGIFATKKQNAIYCTNIFYRLLVSVFLFVTRNCKPFRSK